MGLKGICLKIGGLRLQIVITTLHSIMNIIGNLMCIIKISTNMHLQ
jgi:hypothetical protein